MAEGIRFTTLSGKSKIPDFMQIDKRHKHVRFWEIKSDKIQIDELKEFYRQELPCLYDSFVDDENWSYDIKFIDSSSFTPKVKNLIISTDGIDFYNDLLDTYKNQTSTYTGFPGNLNPMFGKTHTSSTKKKISIALTGKMAGSKNPNFGKIHTSIAKVNIGAKWYDVNEKYSILRNSLLNKLSIISYDEYQDFIRYAIQSLANINCVKPKFMNGIISIKPKKVIEVFGSYDNFWNFVRMEQD